MVNVPKADMDTDGIMKKEDASDKNDDVNDGVKSKIGASEQVALSHILEKPEITAKDLSVILNL